jgi:hypothetical protein
MGAEYPSAAALYEAAKRVRDAGFNAQLAAEFDRAIAVSREVEASQSRRSVEGAVRLCGAAFTDNILGTSPLYLADKIFAKLFLPPAPKTVDFQASDTDPSFFGAIWERIFLTRTAELPDELTVKKSGTEEILEVHASRRKMDWTPPCVIRYAGNYYRLESATRSSSRRCPFLYTLHRLPAGVPGRTVVLYNP